MCRMTWRLATLQRLEPVGPDRDYGTGVPRRTRRTVPGWRHRNTTAASPYVATGRVGSDRSRTQPARLTRATTSPTTVLIHLSTRPLTSPEFLRNRVISGVEMRAVDQCLLVMNCSECDITSIICCYSYYHTAPVRTLPYVRDEYRADRAFTSYTMAMLNAIYDTPTCSPVHDDSTDSQSVTFADRAKKPEQTEGSFITVRRRLRSVGSVTHCKDPAGRAVHSHCIGFCRAGAVRRFGAVGTWQGGIYAGCAVDGMLRADRVPALMADGILGSD